MNQDGFIKIVRDKEKAMSMLKMVDVTLELINSTYASFACSLSMTLTSFPKNRHL